MRPLKKIIISRTDNLGDVLLTLPIAGILKKKYPDCIIYFIGKSYTKALIKTCIHVDEFLDREALLKNNTILADLKADGIVHVFPDKAIAKAAKDTGIPLRIGTSHRWFHWLYCNSRVDFSRKNSDLHEAQLNLKLLKPLGITESFSLPQLSENIGFENIPVLPIALKNLLPDKKISLIFHPKSKGSAREWPMENYFQLAKALDPEKYSIFITGTENEGTLIKDQKKEIFDLPNIIDLTGKCSLEELISFIAAADGLIACSTGPLHIASSLGKNSIGIYPPMRPIHPGRWAPLGKKTTVLSENKICSDCKKDFNCKCIQSITVDQVAKVISTWGK